MTPATIALAIIAATVAWLVAAAREALVIGRAQDFDEAADEACALAPPMAEDVVDITDLDRATTPADIEWLR
jgi:hypothetical protein